MKWLPALLALPLLAAAADMPAPSRLALALGWDVKKQGLYPTAIAADQENNVWVGTEGNGLWRYDPKAKSWQQYTTKDGLGDDCVYALAVDNQDRIWAGHLNHGVSVFNGQKWRDYGILEGPIGDRVFAIALSPKDGDVWIGTDLGLARYRQDKKDWDYYTRASGLPSDQIAGLTFDQRGALYAATQSDGVASAQPDDDYAKWRAEPPATQMTPVRQEVPLGLCNGIATIALGVSAPDTRSVIAVPTPLGLAILTSLRQGGQRIVLPNGRTTVRQDGGLTLPWMFFRTRDPQAAAGAFATGFQNDSISGIAGTSQNLWISYRKSGVAWAGANFTQPKLAAQTEHPDAVLMRATLAVDDMPPLFAAYGAGLMTLPDAQRIYAAGRRAAASPEFPQPPSAPQPDDAKPLATLLDKVSKPLAPGDAVYIADDWRTQGDWVGRYGNSFALLGGMGKEGDSVFPLQEGYEVKIAPGPNHKPGHDAAAHPQVDGTDRRFLYDPDAGRHRGAAASDGSEDAKLYPDAFDGPDLWVTLKVPDGVHCLSLYFVNEDAHAGGSGLYRDYDLSIVDAADDAKKTQDAPPLARSRVTDFWGGVYKQFMIAGPCQYVVRIGRNGSSGTRLEGLFLDRVSGDAPNNPGALPGFATIPYVPPDVPEDYKATPLTQGAVSLWSLLDNALTMRGAVPLQMPFRIWCYRAAVAGKAPEDLLEHWRWQVSIWTQDDRAVFDDAMRKAHDSLNGAKPDPR